MFTFKAKGKDETWSPIKEEQVERDILYKLDIRNVNLEDFGCPKYNELPEPTVEIAGTVSKNPSSAR